MHILSICISQQHYAKIYKRVELQIVTIAIGRRYLHACCIAWREFNLSSNCLCLSITNMSNRPHVYVNTIQDQNGEQKWNDDRQNWWWWKMHGLARLLDFNGRTYMHMHTIAWSRSIDPVTYSSSCLSNPFERNILPNKQSARFDL